MVSTKPDQIGPLTRANILHNLSHYLVETHAAESVWVGLPDAVLKRVSVPGTYPLGNVLAKLPPGDYQRVVQGGAVVTGHGRVNSQAERFWAAIPVPIEEYPSGLLLVTRLEPFQEAQLKTLLESTRKQFSIPIEHALLKQAARQFQATAEALQNVSLRISSSLDLGEVLQTIVQSLKELLGASAVCVMLLDKQQSLQLFATTGLPPGAASQSRLQTIQGFGQQVVRSGRPLNIADTWQQVLQPGDSTTLRSLLVVPLVVDGLVTGTLSVDSEQPGAFGADTERLLTIAAAQAAIAIQNARLYQTERRRADEMEVITGLSRTITQNLEIEQVFQSAHQAILRLMPCEAFFISLRDPQETEIAISYRIDKEERYPETRIPLGSGLSGYVIRTGKKILVRDLGAEKLPFDGIPFGDQQRVRSVIAVPLCFNNENIGMVSTQSYYVNAFNDHDLRLLQNIADHIAIAVTNARLFSDLQQRFLSLQELDQVRSEVIQNVSHELRTPITFLRGYIDLLLDENLGPLNEKQRKSLSIVQAKTATLVRLIEDITTFEDHGQDWLIPQEVNLLQLAQIAVGVAKITAAETGNQLILEAPDDLPPIQGDPDRISQVFDNLLSNAIKYGSPNSTIAVRIVAGQSHVRVSVTDHGEGIPLQEQERVFDRFYQVDGSPSRRHSGLGLGLSIVKHIVESHGGEVWIESVGGSGSTVYFTLPFYFREVQAG